MSRLPQAHQQCFIYIMVFIQKILKNITKSVNYERVLILFASVILQPPWGSENSTLAEQQASIRFLERYMTTLQTPQQKQSRCAGVEQKETKSRNRGYAVVGQNPPESPRERFTSVNLSKSKE